MTRSWILDEPVPTTAGPVGRFFEKIEAMLAMIFVASMSVILSFELVMFAIIPWVDTKASPSALLVIGSILVGVFGVVSIRVNWPIARWTYHFLKIPRACVALSVVKMMRRQPAWVRYAVPLTVVADLFFVGALVLLFQGAVIHDMAEHPRLATVFEITSQIGFAYGSNQLLMLLLSNFGVRDAAIARFYHARYALDLVIVTVLWLTGVTTTHA